MNVNGCYELDIDVLRAELTRCVIDGLVYDVGEKKKVRNGGWSLWEYCFRVSGDNVIDYCPSGTLSRLNPRYFSLSSSKMLSLAAGWGRRYNNQLAPRL